MTDNRYPTELLSDYEDDGTMPANVEQLRQSVVGRRIVKVEQREYRHWWYRDDKALFITLDDGTEVRLVNTDDCCAFTGLQEFLLHVDRIDHMILGVGTTGEYTRWHIYADWGDILELQVGWSCGNPFYYGYGFDIEVIPSEEADRD